jgi:hypothetical protein
VKVSSNLEIARSLRNGFRASLEPSPAGVERRNSAGGLPAYPPKPNSEYREARPRESERGGEASRSRGEEPRPPTKAPKPTLSDKGSGIAVTAGMLA